MPDTFTEWLPCHVKLVSFLEQDRDSSSPFSGADGNEHDDDDTMTD